MAQHNVVHKETWLLWRQFRWEAASSQRTGLNSLSQWQSSVFKWMISGKGQVGQLQLVGKGSVVALWCEEIRLVSRVEASGVGS